MHRPPVRVTITLDPAARRAQFLYRRAVLLNVAAVLIAFWVMVAALWTKSFSAWATVALLVAFALLFLASRDMRRARPPSSPAMPHE